MSNNSAFIRAIEESVIIPEALKLEATTEYKGKFSSKYTKKINLLIRNRKKSYYPLIKTTFRRVITIIAAAIIAGSITVGAVPELREWFVGLFVTANEKNADVIAVNGDVPASELKDDFLNNEPTFLPYGFKESDRIAEEKRLKVIYQNESNKKIVFNQSEINVKNNIDTEEMKVEQVEINGSDAIISYDNEYSIIVWLDENYSYSISGDLCKSDIISIAKSVKVTK